jgi:VCBS repeat-containing protein
MCIVITNLAAMYPAIEYSAPTGPKLLGLDYGYFFVQPRSGTGDNSALIDREGLARIELQPGTWLKQMAFLTEGNGEAFLRQTPGEVELGTSDGTVAPIIVNGDAIGTVDLKIDTEIYFHFDNDVSTEAVETLIKSLAYATSYSSAATPVESLYVVLWDNLDQAHVSWIFAADQITGTIGDDRLEIASNCVSWGDEIDGKGGADTLALVGGGVCDFLHVSKFANFETLLGSTEDDTLHLWGENLGNLRVIDGGGQERDYLHLHGEIIDLRGRTITGFKLISCFGFGTNIFVDDWHIARLLSGRAADEETVTVATVVITDAQRLEMHKNGIDFVSNNGRTSKLADFEAAPPPNAAPSRVNLNSASVMENGTTGAIVGTLSADDLDVGDMHTFELTNTAGGRFKIMDGKLVIDNAALIDFETAKAHEVTIKVTDKAGASHETTLTVTVEDVNEAPIAIRLNANIVREHAVADQLVGFLSTQDQDGAEVHTFELVDDAGGRFAIKNGGLHVKNGVALDHEQVKSHAVAIRVTDKGGLTYNQSFIVDVTDWTSEFVTGTEAGEIIKGGSGSDLFKGIGGNDTLHGGAGKDMLEGGAGKDVFVFDTPLNKKTNLDKIMKFSAKDDALWLDNAVFKGLGKGSVTQPVKLKKSAFALDSAKDASDRIVYNTKTGAISYDVDGSGQKAAVQFAKLDKNLKMAAADFFVV